MKALGMVFLGCAAGLAVAQSTQTAPTIRTLTLRQKGREISLAQFVRYSPAALIVIREPLATEACLEIGRARRRLADERVLTASLDASGKPCRLDDEIAIVDGRTIPLGLASGLVIIDTGAVLRKAVPFAPTAQSLSGAAETVIRWVQGKQAFVTHCGHCHGDDGADTSYVGVKTLAGISGRMSDEKILEGGQLFGDVDITSWPSESKQILLLFISTL